MSQEFKRFLKHSSIYTVGNVLNRLGAFVLLPLYTRHMRVAEYGALELFYSTKTIIASMLSVGLAHATLRFYFEYDKDEDRNKVVGTTLVTMSMISLPVALILSLGSSHLSMMVFKTPDYIIELNLLLAILILELTSEIGLAYLRAKEYSIRYVFACLLQLIVNVSCSYYTVAILEMGVRGVLIGNLISVAVGWLVVVTASLKECGIHFDLEKLKRIFHYTLPFLFSSLFGVIVGNADRFILRSYGSIENVGLYSLAVKFGMLMQVLFLEPFNQSFGSFRFSIMKNENAKEILSGILKFKVFGLLFLGLGISLFARPVLHWMTTPEYYAAYRLVPLIVLSYSIGGLTYFFQTGILYQKKTKYMFYITVASGLTALLFNFLLIPQLDALGAVYSLVAKGAVMFGLTYYVSHRLYPIKYDHGSVLKMYGVAMAVFAASLLLSEDVPMGVVIGVNHVLAFSFPFLLYFLGCVNKEELELANSVLQSALVKFRLRQAKGPAA